MFERSLEREAWRSAILRLAELRRYTKRALLAVADLLTLGLALWLALSIRLGELYVAATWQLMVLFCAAPILGVATFFRLGVYRLVTRHIGDRGASLIAAAVAISSLLWATLVLLSGVQWPYAPIPESEAPDIRVVPRSVIVLYPLLAALLVCGLRRAISLLFDSIGVQPVRAPAKSVLIFGAGRLGMQVADALRGSGEASPVGFVDANPTLWGQYIRDLKIFRPEKLAELVERREVSEVLIAFPQSERRERHAALRLVNRFNVGVRTLATLEDLAEGRAVVNKVRAVRPEDLLLRARLPIDARLMARDISGKCVMVVGAGGAIGSSVVRQALRRSPRHLVLFDTNETRLYDILAEVEGLLRAMDEQGDPLAEDKTKVVGVLGSIGDRQLVRKTLVDNGVETLYHAAAFKRVELIERNVAAGVENNAFGTAVLAQVSAEAGVARFTMVSTSEAGQPFSMVAASLRLAEMVVQALAAQPETRTVFSVVRFGAAIDGPGSLMDRLRREIEAGGPVCLSHAHATCHGVSGAEAAELIIQAGALARGGEVFTLDMGERLRVEEVARSMIECMGLTVRDNVDHVGEIAFEYVDSERGEALREQQEVHQQFTATEHPGILHSGERQPGSKELEKALEGLRGALQTGDPNAIRTVLYGVVGAPLASQPARPA